ncbi:Protein F54D5.15 b [Aphelenchoides avenae]|nr:Protein F54D5.15 b [Aphelenchus avenae]
MNDRPPHFWKGPFRHANGSISDTSLSSPPISEDSATSYKDTPVFSSTPQSQPYYESRAPRTPHASPRTPHISPRSHSQRRENALPQQNGETESYWQRIAEEPVEIKTPSIKSFWEATAEKERIEALKAAQHQPARHHFTFPKWRSNDAMSASLVASAPTPTIIPTDSQVPEQRRRKIEETERKAQVVKQLIHDSVPVKQPLHINAPVNIPLAVDHRLWCDPDRIRESIKRESIANVSRTKERFETGEAFYRSPSPEEMLVDNVPSHNGSPVTLLARRDDVHVLDARNGNALPPQHRQAHTGTGPHSQVPLNNTLQVHTGGQYSNGYVTQPASQSSPASSRQTKSTRSRIDEEIFTARVKEEELRETRQQMGFPSLEELLWYRKNGYPC